MYADKLSVSTISFSNFAFSVALREKPPAIMPSSDWFKVWVRLGHFHYKIPPAAMNANSARLIFRHLILHKFFFFFFFQCLYFIYFEMCKIRILDFFNPKTKGACYTWVNTVVIYMRLFLTPAIVLMIFFLMLSTFLLSVEFSKKITPYGRNIECLMCGYLCIQ
jgi:hypothetical protein